MKRQQPPWRRVFDRVERKIGEPLEGMVTSNKFVDVMATGMKAKRAVTGSAGWLVGGALRKVLHTANIATLSDVKRVNGHLSDLATEMRAVPPPAALPGPKPVAPATKPGGTATGKTSSSPAKRTTQKTTKKTVKKTPDRATGTAARRRTPRGGERDG